MNPVEPYHSFSELAAAEKEGVDFTRRVHDRASHVAIIAPHGGGIEPGTSELTLALAGEDYSYYILEGQNDTHCERMHITSHRFDDPECVRLVQRARQVLAVHGCSGDQPVVNLGGRDDRLRLKMLAALKQAGFRAQEDRQFPGRHPHNICNRSCSGGGVQLELSEGLRRQLFAGLRRTERQTPTPAFHYFVQAIRGALSQGEDTEASTL